MVLLRFLSILPKILWRPCALLVSCSSFAYVVTAACSLQMWATLSVEFPTDIHWSPSFVIVGIRFEFISGWDSNICPIFWNVTKCCRSLRSNASITTLAFSRCQFLQICDIWLILVLWNISSWPICNLFPRIWFLRIRILIWAYRPLALISQFFHFLILVRNPFLWGWRIPLLGYVVQNIIFKQIRWVYMTRKVASWLLHILTLLNSILVSSARPLFLDARAFTRSCEVLKWLVKLLACCLVFIIDHLFGWAKTICIFIVYIWHRELLVNFWCCIYTCFCF